MLLWDIAGGAKFGHLRREYLKEAVSCVFVVDATRFETIEGMQQWYKTLKETNPHIESTNFPAMIIVNKMDLIKDNDIAPLKQKVEEAANKMQFKQGTPEIHYFSTKENHTFDVTNDKKENNHPKSAGELLDQLGENIYNTVLNEERVQKNTLDTPPLTSTFSIFGRSSTEKEQLQKVDQSKDNIISKCRLG